MLIALALAATLGVVNPAVTQATIAQTICVHGWTKTVRPPASFTNHLKASQVAPGTDLHATEEDHVMPLELGGAPRDPDNLRPQPWAGPAGAHAKDAEETRLAREVCAGALTLEQGRDEMRAWIVAHNPYGATAP